MKKISEESPPPSFIVRYNHHEDDGDVQAAVGEETKGNDANNEIKGDTAHAAKHHRHKAKPPRFLLYRTERKYLTMQVSELKKTKLKDVVFDMARDVMQVEPHRHLDYDMAQNEYWWPSGVVCCLVVCSISATVLYIILLYVVFLQLYCTFFN